MKTMSSNLSDLENKIGYWFRDPKILREAITHDSKRAVDVNMKKYERLEYLGEAVIKIVITEYLFKVMQDANGGILRKKRTEMVCRKKQTQISNELQLCQYIHKSPGVQSNFNRYDKFVEAIIGAVYVDAGFGERGLAKVKLMIYKFWKIQEPAKINCVIM